MTAVIRTNKRLYDRSEFTMHGIAHHDIIFPDGTTPVKPNKTKQDNSLSRPALC